MLPVFRPSRTTSDPAIWLFFLASRHTPPVVMTHPPLQLLRWGWPWSQPIDQPQDFLEQFLRHRDLGRLEDDVAAMAHDLGADLHEFFPQAGQRPLFYRLRQSQRPHEVTEIVGQRMQLKPDGVGGEGAARQPRPLRSVLSFLDPLLRRAAPVVEGDDALGRARQVGHDKSNRWIKLARMPFDFRHHPARRLPALRLIAEVGVVRPDFDGRTTNRALERMSDAFLKNLIGGEPDCVFVALRLQELVEQVQPKCPL